VSLELGFFYAFALLAVLSAVASLCLVRRPVAGVLAYLVMAFCLSGIALLLEAHFVSIALWLIASGAAAMMLVFAVMLATSRDSVAVSRSGHRRSIQLVAVGAAVLLLTWAFVGLDLPGVDGAAAALPEGHGSARQVGTLLFGEFAVPVEVAAFIFLAASLASFMLAKRRLG
jgi:NADH-quinone oxidoreductase subunit J